MTSNWDHVWTHNRYICLNLMLTYIWKAFSPACGSALLAISLAPFLLSSSSFFLLCSSACFRLTHPSYAASGLPLPLVDDTPWLWGRAETGRNIISAWTCFCLFASQDWNALAFLSLLSSSMTSWTLVPFSFCLWILSLFFLASQLQNASSLRCLLLSSSSVAKRLLFTVGGLALNHGAEWDLEVGALERRHSERVCELMGRVKDWGGGVDFSAPLTSPPLVELSKLCFESELP